MKKALLIMLSGSVLLTTSCASIVSRSNYPITINSNPSDARITITDKKGIDIYKGSTPATVTLKSGAGFFSKARYSVKFEKSNYDVKVVPIEFKLNGWYFGNILFGGVIGMLIVDPATGAMYRLDTEFVNETLSRSVADSGKEELKVMNIGEIPTEWKNHLVALEK